VKHLILRFGLTRRLLSFLARKHCPIFVYHRFGDGGISAGAFAAQLDEIQRCFYALSLAEYCQQRKEGRTDWRRTCVITVDDGYRDCYLVGYPALRQRAFQATLFVTTAFVFERLWLWWDVVDYIIAQTPFASKTVEYANQKLALDFSSPEARRTSWSRVGMLCSYVSDSQRRDILRRLSEDLGVQIPPIRPDQYQSCTPDELNEMAAHGIALGPHTVHHPILSQCEPEQWKQEIIESRHQLSGWVHEYVDIFAYPSGTKDDYNESMSSFLESSGFQAAVADHYDDFANETNFTLRRYPAPAEISQFLWVLYGGEYVCIRAMEFIKKIMGRP